MPRFFLASGTMDQTTLIADTDNNIENFPEQSDMQAPLNWTWAQPTRDLTQRPRPARVLEMPDGSQRDDGFFNFTWGFQFHTFDQFDYMINTIMSGPDWAEVTVQTFFSTNHYRCFNAHMLKPREGIDYKPADDGLFDVLYRFVHGIDITTIDD